MTGPTTVSCYITEILTDSTACTHKAQYPRSLSAIIKEFIRVRLKVESIEELVVSAPFVVLGRLDERLDSFDDCADRFRPLVLCCADDSVACVN